MSASTTNPDNKEPAQAAEPPQKKSLWETTVTSTPVIMTVIATLLAGMSASEMTYAQYFRSTAAQNQSKVEGEYAFFQAKRQRGTTMEMTSTLLQAFFKPGRFDARTLQNTSNLLASEAKRAEERFQKLEEAVKSLNRPGTGKAEEWLGNFQQAVSDASVRMTGLTDRAAALQKTTTETLARDKKQLEPALAYLKKGLPKSNDVTMEDREDLKPYAGEITELLQASRNRRPEKDTAPLIRKVPEPALKEAYWLNVENSKAFEKVTDEVQKGLDTLKGLVEQQMALAETIERADQELTLALPEPSEDESAGLKKVRSAVNALTQTDKRIQDAVGKLSRDYRASFIDYEARAYRAEAKYNNNNGALYELLVRKTNWESDRHMGRKSLLFYAMLAAQAGVTVATLALAVRQKSAVWGLAAAAGMAAVAFGGYVSVTM